MWLGLCPTAWPTQLKALKYVPLSTVQYYRRDYRKLPIGEMKLA